MSICQKCGMPIEWITVNSSLVPVDETPVFIIEGDGAERFLTDEGKVLTGRPANHNETNPDLPVAFILHRRTCHNAAGFWREPEKPP